MREPSAAAIRGLAVDIEAELSRLEYLEAAIARAHAEAARNLDYADLIYESLALKLHNFYTRCEHIFNLIVSELNGAPVSGFDWHKRLLERMASQWESRPPVLRIETVTKLREYMGFRHVVRNMYGFELRHERIDQLVETYPIAWHALRTDIEHFLAWLRQLADQLDGIIP